MPIRTAAVALVLLLTACARPGAGQTDTPQPTAPASSTFVPSPSVAPRVSPTLHVDRPPDEMSITGTLGSVSIEGGCAYVETEDSTRYDVIYPSGWRLTLSPLELRNPDGELVASGGATILVRGQRKPEMMSTCQIGPVFQATEVVTIDR